MSKRVGAKAQSSQTTSLLIALLAIVGLIAIIFTQTGNLAESVDSVRHANKSLIGLAILTSLGTYIAATTTYYALSLRPINYGQTFIAQVASTFSNRLLPAGAGGIATLVRYFMKHGHSAVEAGSVVIANNSLGLVGHFMVLGVAVACNRAAFVQYIHFRISSYIVLGALLVLAAVCLVVLLMPGLRKWITKLQRSLQAAVHQLVRRPGRIGVALISSITVTLLYAVTLFLLTHALHENLTILQVLLVFTAGVAAASVTPTPGGLGGAEAGLVAAFVSMGVSAEKSLSIALVYRFLTYWVPLLPGFLAFQYALRRKLI